MPKTAGGVPSKRWSIVAWALVGAIAVVVSYVIMLGVAAYCVYFAIYALRSASFSSMILLLAAFGAVAGITIFWSILPRPDKFQAPGVLIDLAREKRLSAELAAIAQEMNEPMPSEVYLIADANAWVAQRGGLLGFGSRRVMGLGLPVMQILTISQFRAVLAHEFGHFYGGDTQMGPWIYRTRSAMVRVVQNLGHKSEIMRVLTRFYVIAIAHMILVNLLVGYWKLFMRLTQFVSRRQEYRSDELACHIAGSEALAGGLVNICKVSAANPAYWQSILLPIAAGGYLPRVGDGFRRFMAAPHITQATSKVLNERLKNPKTDPLDTHPPLHARLARARSLGIATRDESSDAAISLLDGVPDLEAALVRMLLPKLKETKLTSVAWENASVDIYTPLWRRQIAPFKTYLSRVRMASFAALLREPRELAEKIPNPPGMLLNREMRAERAAGILDAAFNLCLMDNGWKLYMEPGVFLLVKDDHQIDQPSLMAKLGRGHFNETTWRAFMANNGIDDWTLVPEEATAEVVTPQPQLNIDFQEPNS